MKKIKNSQLLLSHGNISAREKVLTLTDKVLDRLDSRERLKQMIKRIVASISIYMITYTPFPQEKQEITWQEPSRIFSATDLLWV